MTNKYKKIVLVIVILFLLIITGVVFYLFASKNFTDSLYPVETGTPYTGLVSEDARADLPTSIPSVNLSGGLVKYENDYYNLKLSYPNNLSVSEFAENGGGRTIVFEEVGVENGNGFQIFITPYKFEQITKERFKMDEPSGVMQEPVEIIIDGIRATMFFGKNGIMGETREVWFIKGGFLYEIMTYKDLDEWLSKIMATWKFTQ
ncbi:MAG: hypothetical protein AAB446_00075 [Patescibacteria group bacterium]